MKISTVSFGDKSPLKVERLFWLASGPLPSPCPWGLLLTLNRLGEKKNLLFRFSEMKKNFYFIPPQGKGWEKYICHVPLFSPLAPPPSWRVARLIDVRKRAWACSALSEPSSSLELAHLQNTQILLTPRGEIKGTRCIFFIVIVIWIFYKDMFIWVFYKDMYIFLWG